MDLSKTFVREFDVDNINICLSIHQILVGDVGCVVWDAALVLAKYLINANTSQCQLHLLRNSTVIELGAGTALPGITAAALGANVIVTDLEECLPLMQKNIDCNRHVIEGKIKALSLCWGSSVDHLPTPQFILASDCLYYSESLEPLVKTLCKLSDSSTKIIFCYEHRDSRPKKELEAKFFKLIEERFTCFKVPPEHFHPDYCCPDIHIVIFRKKN